MPEPIQPVAKPKKSFSMWKFVLYSLAALGFVWVAVEAYWGYFKLKHWIKGFGVGAFFVGGLVAGFLYLFMAYRLFREIQSRPEGVKKAGAYTAFGLGVVALNPALLGSIVWLFTPQGTFHTASFWGVLGSLLGAGMVYGVGRLFSNKKPGPGSPGPT
jgi:hypothetical protein